MANKTLKIRRVFAWAIFDNLKRTPPKDYHTTGEIKSTISDVIPALTDAVAEYSARIIRAVELSEKAAAKEISEDEVKAGVDKINDEWRAYNRESGNDVVEIVL